MPRERREQQGGREGGSTEGIPMGLSLLVCTKCLHRQLQTQVCDVGQTCCWTSNHPKSPLDLHFNKTEWTLCFSRTWDFLSFPCLKITIQRFLEAMIRPVWDVGVVLDRHLDFKGQGVVKSTTLHFFQYCIKHFLPVTFVLLHKNIGLLIILQCRHDAAAFSCPARRIYFSHSLSCSNKIYRIHIGMRHHEGFIYQ